MAEGTDGGLFGDESRGRVGPAPPPVWSTPSPAPAPPSKPASGPEPAPAAAPSHPPDHATAPAAGHAGGPRPPIDDNVAAGPSWPGPPQPRWGGRQAPMGRARYRSQYRTGTTYRTIHQRNAFYATPAIWIFYGLITFGIMYPVAAFLFFRRARQTAAAADAGTPFRARYLRPPASRLTVWALVYSGLTVVAAAIAIAAGAHSSQPSTPPFVQLTEPLGGTATIQDEVALNPGGVAPVALTVSTFSDPAKAPGGGNVEAEVRVCATTKAIDPSLMADAFLLQPGGIDAQTYNVIESAVPASLQVQQLNPGQCASGTLSWLVPAGTQLQSVSYEGLQSVTWPVS